MLAIRQGVEEYEAKGLSGGHTGEHDVLRGQSPWRSLSRGCCRGFCWGKSHWLLSEGWRGRAGAGVEAERLPGRLWEAGAVVVAVSDMERAGLLWEMRRSQTEQDLVTYWVPVERGAWSRGCLPTFWLGDRHWLVPWPSSGHLYEAHSDTS